MKHIPKLILTLLMATLGTFVCAAQAPAGVEADEMRWRVKAMAAVEAAVPQAAKDPTRPVFHFRPPALWMNDICGAIYHQGYYHVFYQYNPFSGDSWGDNYTLWAHARSRDLVHWEDLAWAFLPMKERGERRCNSGCVTLDGNGRPLIFYTFVPEGKDATRLGKREHWAVAPLDDGLVKWRRLKDAPLMAAGMNGVPANVNAGWSDPFVFKSAGRTFVTFKECDGLVCEAKDKELTRWEYAGKLSNVAGECPNFFPLQDRWLLVRSTQPISCVVGEFDAETIAFKESGAARVMDHGFGKHPPGDRSWTRGLYGTSTFTDKDGRRILLGWICGFKPRRGWNGCMSLPRILTLDKDGSLIQTPAPELRDLRGRHTRAANQAIRDEFKLIDGAKGRQIELMAEFAAGDARAFGLKLRSGSDGTRAITLRYEGGTLNVAGTEVPLALRGEGRTFKLHVFLDRSVMEVFINGGREAVTRVEYPDEDDLGIAVFAENGSATLDALDVWEMKSIW